MGTVPCGGDRAEGRLEKAGGGVLCLEDKQGPRSWLRSGLLEKHLCHSDPRVCTQDHDATLNSVKKVKGH